MKKSDSLFNSLDDVMRRLTILENISNGHDKYYDELRVIADMLELFHVKWEFIEDKENDKFIARLK